MKNMVPYGVGTLDVWWSYQLRGAGVRLETQAALGCSSSSEWLESLPQLLREEGHEWGEEGKRHRHAVIEDAAGHLPRSAAGLCVSEGRGEPHPPILLDQHRF